MCRNRSGPPWTAEEIGCRLGISTAIYQKIPLGAREIAAIRHSGITRIELLLKPGSFHYRNRAQAAEVLDECRRQGITVVSVHGLLGLPYNSREKKARRIVLRESLSAIRFAEEAGAAIYVGHFGHNEHSRGIVDDLLEQTEGVRIKLTTENMGALPSYVAAVDKVNSDRFGLTVDIGHPREGDGVNPFTRSDRARRTLAECGDAVFHVHLHETFDLEKHADHRPPLHEDGIIEWGEVLAALREIGYRGELLFEDGRGENPKEWLQMTAEFPRAFVGRYRDTAAVRLPNVDF